MQKRQFKITGPSLPELVDYLKQKNVFLYKNQSEDMAVLFLEEFYNRTGSVQLNMVIAKSVDAAILVDAIGAAGAVGLLNVTWGSEGEYVEQVQHILEKYTKDNNFGFELVKGNPNP